MDRRIVRLDGSARIYGNFTVKILLAISVAVLPMAMATQSSASEFIQTYEGVVELVTLYSHKDADNLFGVSDSSLVGMQFIAQYVYNTTWGHLNSDAFCCGAVGYDLSYFTSQAYSITSASLEIDGVVQKLPAGWIGGNFLSALLPDGYSETESSASVVDANGSYLSFYSSGFGFITPYDIPYNISISPGLGIGSGIFNVKGFDYIDFRLSTSSVSLYASDAVYPSPAPEPDIWVMMLIGLGSVGAGLRSLRQKTTRHIL